MLLQQPQSHEPRPADLAAVVAEVHVHVYHQNPHFHERFLAHNALVYAVLLFQLEGYQIVLQLRVYILLVVLFQVILQLH